MVLYARIINISVYKLCRRPNVAHSSIIWAPELSSKSYFLDWSLQLRDYGRYSKYPIIRTLGATREWFAGLLILILQNFYIVLVL